MSRERSREMRGVRSLKLYIGLSIIFFYALLGTYSMFAGYTGSLQASWEADALAMPFWAAYLLDPSTPPTIEKRFSEWMVVGGNASYSIDDLNTSRVIFRKPGYLAIVSDALEYKYKPARAMIIYYNIKVSTKDSVRYSITVSIVNDNTTGKRILYRGSQSYIEVGRYSVLRVEETIHGGSRVYEASIRLPYSYLNRIQEEPLPIEVNPVSEILLSQGSRIRWNINISYSCMDGECGDLEILLGSFSIKILGLAYGIMGTDHRGSDIWRQFIEGARVANIFGLSAAAITVAIAISIGSIAGFRAGRLSDQLLTFLTDAIFFLPAVPLIMISTALLGRSMPVLYGIIILVSWPGLARLTRSWAMAIRSEPYVEASVALGASRLWILRRHIIPRLAPLAGYGMVSLVPGVISTEILIQFIGFGDPNIPSWGRMLNEAFNEGALINGAWWWLFAPIAGITSYMAGFALIGMYIEERVNPRLAIAR